MQNGKPKSLLINKSVPGPHHLSNYIYKKSQNNYLSFKPLFP